MRTDVFSYLPAKFPKRIGIIMVGCSDVAFVKQDEQIPITAFVLVTTGTRTI